MVSLGSILDDVGKVLLRPILFAIVALWLEDAMPLGIKKGSKITVYADGEDENEAVDKLSSLLENLKD